MRIRKLYLKDIGPFNEVEFEFKPQAVGKAEVHILTGPNGSGKTTTLQALASLFCRTEDFRNENLNNAFIKRFRSTSNGPRQDYQRRLYASFDKSNDIEIRWLQKARGIVSIDFSLFNVNEEIEIYRQLGNFPPVNNDFFVVAYSGYRNIHSANINAIEEPSNNPLADSLDFVKDNHRSRFSINQWVANNISKRAIAKENNSPQEAVKFAKPLTILEETISNVIGSQIEFEIKTSPLSLQLKVNDILLDIDVLPDGLKSLISWLGDLLKRLDLVFWEKDLPINEQSLILLLDEIEVHLHPAWQRKILPAVQKLFPNAQIFLTTHSPFVVNSVDGAAVYELKVENGKAYLGEVTESKSSASYESVLREVFDIEDPFGEPVTKDLAFFQQQRTEILQGKPVDEPQFLALAQKLASQSAELQGIVAFELRQLEKNIGRAIGYDETSSP